MDDRVWAMRFHGIIAILALAAPFVRAQNLPQRGAASTAAAGVEEFFTMPPLVLEAAELPDVKVSEAEVERSRVERDRARAKGARWVGLQKSGVLSKVEAERAQRSASQASLRYEQRHVALLRQQLDELRARPASAELIAAAEASLNTAQALATQAEVAWNKLEAALSETNVARRRALSRSGSGSKADLRRAESDLARLREAAK